MATVVNFSPRLATADAAADAAMSAGAFGTVEVYDDPGAISEDWAELEAAAAVSPYQTRAFLIPWLETIGADRGVTPFFVLARDQRLRPVGLLCLGIERRGPLRVARFLGGRESNVSLGLFDPAISPTAADLNFLLRAAARAAGAAAPHLYLLQNQPHEWAGVANPFSLLSHQASPSSVHSTTLEPNGDAFLAAKLSKDTRKKLRKKEARLAEIGPITLVTNDTPDRAANILSRFLTDKIARLQSRAIATDFTNPATQAFLEKLSMPADGPPWLEFYALACGERIVATYAGARHGTHFSCMINSFDMDAEIAKTSPGELLLMRLIARKCDEGCQSFDLGIGEARYKTTYCDHDVPLFDAIVPVSVIGRIFAITAALSLRAKRRIKQNPNVLKAMQRLRARMPGLIKP